MDDFASVERALTAIHRVVKTIGEDDLDRPTPCPDFDVTALADHLVDTIARLGAAAGIPVTQRAGDSIDQRIQDVTGQVLAGWRLRGLSEPLTFSGRILTGAQALGILTLELVVHGWDFAVALRAQLTISAVHAAHVLTRARQTLTAQSRAVAGFDPPVSVGEAAGPFEQLTAFTGRDPLHGTADRHAGRHGRTAR